jgi:ribose transport system permease protein
MADTTADTATAPEPSRWTAFLRDNLPKMGTLIGLIVLCAVFASLTPVFLTPQNLVNILQQSSINALIAIGMTLVIISGGIDLSVGPIAALTAMVTATLLVAGYPFIVCLAAALAIGAACGAFNGGLIAIAGLQPFIVTLGTWSLFRSFALIYTGGNTVLGIPKEFRQLFSAQLWIFPVPVVLVLILGVVAAIMLSKTPIGEYILAVGGNEEAARISGVPIARTKITAYVISGMLASLAAVIVIARLGAAEPTIGYTWELDAIAAAAIGGTSLMGGKGSITGCILGAILLGAMRNGLTLLNVSPFYQPMATGIIILLAMLMDRVTRGKG